MLAFGLATILAASCPAAAADSGAAPATCSNGGQTYAVGQYACIRACRGSRRLARCDMVSQQPSWTFVSDVCPSAYEILPVPRTSPIPVASTRMSVIPVQSGIPQPGAPQRGPFCDEEFH